MGEGGEQTGRRVAGTGSGARVSAARLGVGWAGAFLVADTAREQSPSVTPNPWLLLSAALVCIVIARAWRIGVSIRGSELTIVSWFSTRRFRFEEIDAILHRPFPGAPRNGAGGGSILSSPTGMIGVRLVTGAEEIWPATITTDQRCFQVTRELAAAMRKPVESIGDI